MGHRGFLAAISILLTILCLLSCKKEDSKDLNFLRNASFCALLEGSLVTDDGEELTFEASIRVERQDRGEAYEITYHAPDAMQGITVRVTQDRETEERSVTASLGELLVKTSHEAVRGWLLPLETLLALPALTPERLQKTPSGYTFTFPEERLLTVDEKGLPLSLKSPKISLSVREIQELESAFSLFCTKQHPMCYSSCILYIDTHQFLC